MPCLYHLLPARKGKTTTMVNALLLLATLLLWTGGGDAAGTGGRTNGEDGSPYLILPPGRTSEDGVPSRDLGEMEFVRQTSRPEIHEDPALLTPQRTQTLRHIYHHGSHRYPHLHRYLDVPPSPPPSAPSASPLVVRAQTTPLLRLSSRRPEDIDALLSHAHTHGTPAPLPPSAWLTDLSAAAPNTSDKNTILTFAKIAANAYVQDHDGSGWKDVKGGFNYTDDFGWEADGLRGHIFADQKNRTIVIGLKGTSSSPLLAARIIVAAAAGGCSDADRQVCCNDGTGTSPALFDGADTTGNDKLNDNLFGSCCCGQGGQYLWKQVCDCMSDAYTCNSTCLVRSLRERGHYYRSVRELYHNVTARYPEVTDVWLSGHSLGGVVAALLGLTYGLPTITFEAFPDALAAKRLGLPVPPGYKIGSVAGERGPERGIFHFGHTADPVYMGMCNGASSMCTIGGYAFQSACHTGRRCVYDTVGDLGWRVGIGTHKIDNVVKDVLERYDGVPQCKVDAECVDCYAWKFFESNGTEPGGSTTSSSSTSTTTQTRTETCKTPGWWGCLDETTTTSTTTTTEETSTTTTTCKTPGWFGCKDPTNTISSSSISATPAPSPTQPSTIQPSSTSTCQTPGWFGCRDPTPSSTSPATTMPSPTNLPSTRRKGPESRTSCVERHWYGICREWHTADIGWKDL